MTFSEKYKDEITDILSRYPVKRSALIPLLYVAQRDQGYQYAKQQPDELGSFEAENAPFLFRFSLGRANLGDSVFCHSALPWADLRLNGGRQGCLRTPAGRIAHECETATCLEPAAE